MSDSLFSLAGEYKELYAMLTEEPDSEVIQDTLESIMGAIEVKSEGYVSLINRLEMEVDACEKQKASWSHKLAVRENAIKRLKQRMAEAMLQLGKDEIIAGDNKITLSKNGGLLPLVYDEDKAVPERFNKITIETDNKKVREALDRGEKLDFVHYGERGKHISIK